MVPVGNLMQGDPWFSCDIANVTLDSDFTPDCFRYLCGDSEKEQCQIGDIRGATCLDIGCSDSGTPNCTEYCKLLNYKMLLNNK